MIYTILFQLCWAFSIFFVNTVGSCNNQKWAMNGKGETTPISCCPGPLFHFSPGFWKANPSNTCQTSGHYTLQPERLWFVFSAQTPACSVHKRAILWDGQESNCANSQGGARRTMPYIACITDVKSRSISPIAPLFLLAYTFYSYMLTGKQVDVSTPFTLL